MDVIINADDFGMSKSVNDAIVDGYINGILSSTCIMPNMEGFLDAVSRLHNIQGIGFGIHLNIIEGKTVLDSPDKFSRLYDKDGFFNNGFLKIMFKSFDDDFMSEVELEFRSQIEKVLAFASPDHLDSHVHVHAIPKIFELVCKLAKEYNIPCVRTQFENIYFDGNWKNFLNPAYYVNLLKIAILNFFTLINRKTLKHYGLKTNDCVIGVGYISMMNENTIIHGVQKVKNKNVLLQIICHPDLNQNRKSNFIEYSAVTSHELIDFFKNLHVSSFKKFFQ